MKSGKHQTQSLGCRRFNDVLMDVSGLFLGATKLQGAGCLRSCTTSSVLGKWTDKNIFVECGALENPQDTNKHTHIHVPSDAHTCPQLGLHNVSAHITIFHIRTDTHAPVTISDNVLFLPHVNTPTITILVCFMPLLCSLSQILQYLCVQQYFNKEYQNILYGCHLCFCGTTSFTFDIFYSNFIQSGRNWHQHIDWILHEQIHSCVINHCRRLIYHIQYLNTPVRLHSSWGLFSEWHTIGWRFWWKYSTFLKTLIFRPKITTNYIVCQFWWKFSIFENVHLSP